MPIDYRACLIARNGDVINRIDLVCDSERGVKGACQQLVDHHAVEIWLADKLVARFLPLES